MRPELIGDFKIIKGALEPASFLFNSLDFNVWLLFLLELFISRIIYYYRASCHRDGNIVDF